MRRFFWIHKSDKLEILGLVPSNPRRNTSINIFELLRSRNRAETRLGLFPPCFLSVSALFPLRFLFAKERKQGRNKAETAMGYRSTYFQ